jgi:hypothetical protein
MLILPLENDEPFAVTLGVMLYPEHKADRISLQALAFRSKYLAEPIRQLCTAGLGETLPREYLLRLLVEGGFPPDDIKQRWKMGHDCGTLLRILWTLSQHDPELATWNNAMKLMEAEASRQGVTGHRTFFQSAKKEFASVAHLWAAWCAFEGMGKLPLSEAYVGLRRYMNFMACAGCFLDWGETFTIDVAKSEPPLRDVQPWLPPRPWMYERRTFMAKGPRRIPLPVLNDADVAALRTRGRPRKVA